MFIHINKSLRNTVLFLTLLTFSISLNLINVVIFNNDVMEGYVKLCRNAAVV